MRNMVSYEGRVEPYHKDRKWLTVNINLTFDKPIERSYLIDFIGENIMSLEEHCKAKMMVATTTPQMEEWYQSILAYHGLLEEYLETEDCLHSSNEGEKE